MINKYKATILITSFHSLISRNILSTDVLRLLGERRVKVVILCPEEKAGFFEQEYGGPDVIIEGVGLRTTRWEYFLRRLALSAMQTRSLRIKRVTELRGRGRILSLFLANRAGQALVRLLNSWLCPRGTFGAYFEKYRPTIVFATDIQHEYDIRLLADARKAGIAAIGMVRSWDNLTAKGLVLALPDELLVHNDIILHEAVQLQGIVRDKVRIVGVPHYDRYLRHRPSIAREQFMRSIDADPSSKLVLYTPTGDRYLVNNTIDCAVLDILKEVVDGRAHILVRFPIADTVACMDSAPDKPGITFERLSKERFGKLKAMELTAEDDRHLIDSLYFADLVVCGPSTICVDAVVTDRPTILVGFDGLEKREYYSGIRRIYDYDHFVPVLESGGVVLAEDPDQFRQALDDYLTGPTLHSDGRQKMVKDQLWNLDGRSSERLVEEIIKFIQ